MGTYAGASCVRVSGHRPGRGEERRRATRDFSYKGTKAVKELIRKVFQATPDSQKSRLVTPVTKRLILVSLEDPELYDRDKQKDELTTREIFRWLIAAEPSLVWQYCPKAWIAEVLPSLIRSQQEKVVVGVHLQEPVFRELGGQIKESLFAESLNCLIMVRSFDAPTEVIIVHGESRRCLQVWLNSDLEQWGLVRRRRQEDIIPKPSLSYC